MSAVDYLMNEVNVKRWALLGSDCVYLLNSNKNQAVYHKAKGVKRFRHND
jgi:hypothetical protein